MSYSFRDGFTDIDPIRACNAVQLPSGDEPLHPAFRKWLETEPATSFLQVLEDISALLDIFVYGKIDHILQHVDIECNASLTKMTLRNYVDMSLDSINGHCGEVNLKAYVLIRKKYPTLNMLRVQGQRGGFTKGWNHWFFLVSRLPFLSGGEVVFTPDVEYYDSTTMELQGLEPLDTESWEPQISKNIFIGDASARTLSPFDCASYVLIPPERPEDTWIDNMTEDPSSLEVSLNRNPGTFHMTVVGQSQVTRTFISIGLHQEFEAPVIGVQKFIGHQNNGDNRRYEDPEFYAYDDPTLIARLEELSPDLVDPIARLITKVILIG
jgi:hypothetical protein